MNISIDSAMTTEEALLQNPQSLAPLDVIKALRLTPVTYYGYDMQLHQGQIVMHEAHEADMQAFFDLARSIRFPICKVIPISDPKYAWDDEVSCTDNNSSGFNYRVIMGTDTLSKHATGCAFDINPVPNIYVRYDESGNEIYRLPKDGVYDEKKLGTLTFDHELVLLMKNRGWFWGGDWKKEDGRIDYQHFEKSAE